MSEVDGRNRGLCVLSDRAQHPSIPVTESEGAMVNWAFSLYQNLPATERGPYAFTDVLSVAAGQQAYQDIRLWQGYAPTPLRDLNAVAARAGVRRVLYKDEASRFGLDSFKALGGAYAVACLLQALLGRRLRRQVSMQELLSGAYSDFTRTITVACASDGNHGRSVAFGAKRFGCACTIFLHERVSHCREQAIVNLGAQVIRTPGNYDDSVRAAKRTAGEKAWYLVADTSDDASDPMPVFAMQGYTSLVIEALAQLTSAGHPLPTHVFVQGGVGGLAAAVISYLWEELGPQRAPTFVIVEPSRANCLHQSAVHGRPTPVTGDLDTVMAGLACGEVSTAAWPIVQAGAEFFMTIEDDAAIECMRLLHRGALGGGSIVAGESAVAGLAGLLALASDPAGEALGRVGLDASSIVLLIGTEGATDPDIYAKLVGSAPAEAPGMGKQ
jgi:diaminopropionate ammonia-lyase